jgi:exodeoxyribonuclease-3
LAYPYIWDRKRREINHSNVVKRLEAKGIDSSYHLFHQQIQGKEIHPNLYMYRHKNKPYHLDYCFLSKDLATQLKNVEVGDYDTWSPFSDHVLLMVTIGND